MADNLSPLVNLDLINQIYKTINAQITERVYNPKYNSEATLGTSDCRYKYAYLEALDVSGKVISTKGFDGGLVTDSTGDCIKFVRYNTASPSEIASTKAYTLNTATVNDDDTEIPTSKAVYAVIGSLEELLKNI